jgi:cysteine desulfurase
MRSTYFDYNATTPLDPQVREAMLPYLGEVFGNPSSIHHIGRRARAVLDDCRHRAAQVLGCKPSEIIFTSGGTESTNLAIFGAARARKSIGKHIVTTAVEHHAVLHSCQYIVTNEDFHLTMLPVGRTGRVSVETVAAAIRPDTTLISIMAANNEIGTVQPVAEIGKLCRKRGLLFHTDAVQWFGKMPFASIDDFAADLVSICAHKIHGPKGAGILYSKSPFFPDPIIFGGSHENERRAGTENVAAVVGMVEALERFVKKPIFDVNRLAPLKRRLEMVVDGTSGVHYVGNREQGLPNTVSLVVEGADSIALLAALDLEGICASSGSACSAGSLEPSHVVAALGIDPGLAKSLVRFSLGRESTADEVTHLENVFPKIIERIRRRKAV